MLSPGGMLGALRCAHVCQAHLRLPSNFSHRMAQQQIVEAGSPYWHFKTHRWQKRWREVRERRSTHSRAQRRSPFASRIACTTACGAHQSKLFWSKLPMMHHNYATNFVLTGKEKKNNLWTFFGELIGVWLHRGRSDTAANANANSDALWEFQTKSCELSVAKEFASECEWLCEWNGTRFVLVAEIPCEWTFATKFGSDCECDGVVRAEKQNSHPSSRKILGEREGNMTPRLECLQFGAPKTDGGGGGKMGDKTNGTGKSNGRGKLLSRYTQPVEMVCANAHRHCREGLGSLQLSEYLFEVSICTLKDEHMAGAAHQTRRNTTMMTLVDQTPTEHPF